MEPHKELTEAEAMHDAALFAAELSEGDEADINSVSFNPITADEPDYLAWLAERQARWGKRKVR